MRYQRGRFFFWILMAVAFSGQVRAQAVSRGELAGLATYTDTARDIYIGGLWTGDGSTAANPAALVRPVTLEYRISIRRISARVLRHASAAGGTGCRRPGAGWASA